MTGTRKIEIFSAGCPTCETAIAEIRAEACSSCDIAVLDMKDDAVAERAAALGVRSVPAVLIDGSLAECCSGRDPNLGTLKAAGLGQPIG